MSSAQLSRLPSGSSRSSTSSEPRSAIRTCTTAAPPRKNSSSCWSWPSKCSPTRTSASSTTPRYRLRKARRSTSNTPGSPPATTRSWTPTPTIYSKSLSLAMTCRYLLHSRHLCVTYRRRRTSSPSARRRPLSTRIRLTMLTGSSSDWYASVLRISSTTTIWLAVPSGKRWRDAPPSIIGSACDSAGAAVRLTGRAVLVSGGGAYAVATGLHIPGLPGLGAGGEKEGDENQQEHVFHGSKIPNGPADDNGSRRRRNGSLTPEPPFPTMAPS